MTQEDIRRGVDVGSSHLQVSPVSHWYQIGHFKNEDEARGAFKLAYQQGLDGMGKSIPDWMGLNEDEINCWLGSQRLPDKKKRKT